MGATQHEIGFNSEQLRKARELALRYGWNATAYQIITPGIELWFSSICEAVVGFVRARNTFVVAGAPVCAPERLADVATEFEQAAWRDGKRVLIRNPEKYDRKQVRTQATYRYGFEWSELYCLDCLKEGNVWVEFERSFKSCTKSSIARSVGDNRFVGRTVNLNRTKQHWYGTGSGSDRVPSEAPCGGRRPVATALGTVPPSVPLLLGSI